MKQKANAAKQEFKKEKDEKMAAQKALQKAKREYEEQIRNLKHEREEMERNITCQAEQATHKLEITEVLVSALYHVDSPQFDAHGVPQSAQVIVGKLKQWNCFTVPDSMLFYKLPEELRAATKTHLGSPQMGTHMLSIAWSLVNILKDLIPESSSEPGKYITKPEPASSGLFPQFMFQMRSSLFDIFTLLVKRTEKELEGRLFSSFFEQQEQHYSRPAVHVTATPTSASATRKSTLSSLIHVMSDIYEKMVENNIPPSVCLHFFAQICFWLNAQLFNKLVSQPELCTCGKGVQIRLGLSQIDEFLLRNGTLSAARPHLEHIKQASNLLVMDKAVLMDSSSVKTAFWALNPVQLGHLVHSFRTDDLLTEPVEGRVLEHVPRLPASSTSPLVLDANALVLPVETETTAAKDDP